MRRLPLFIVTVLGLVSPAAAAADTGLIAVGRSIGAVELEMARAAVIRIYGQPRRAVRIEFVNGERGRLVTYRKHGGALRITYVGRRVVGIDTTARYHRTATGIGPGSPLSAAARSPGFRFDQCTAGYVREGPGVLTFFLAYSDPERIDHVAIYRSAYFDC